jgi:Kef-type K+ transport system membrane component KefB
MMPTYALAATGGHGDATAQILLALAVIAVAAKLGGELMERIRQPAVLGELGVGLLLGNVGLMAGFDVMGLASSDVMVVLSELGAVLLLFNVGLESTPKEMMAVGGRAFLVAVAGVVAPMVLGFVVGEIAMPEASWMVHLFLGAMLSATSVGITARVLSDVGAVREPFARIILGAAVIDDVLGLLVLAVVAGIINAAATGTALGAGAIVMIIVKACAFLVGALVVGSFLSPRVFDTALALRSKGIVLSLALAFCFGMSWLALLAGLAPIVGAFAAGLVLEEAHFKGHLERGEHHLHESMVPLMALLVPIFFVRMGLMVDLRVIADGRVLLLAVLLIIAAILGKLACGLAVPRGMSWLTVGLGMMPRGEVGLIFAAMGARLVLGGHPVVEPSTYAAAVLMVVVTTVLAPPLILWSLRREKKP